MIGQRCSDIMFLPTQPHHLFSNGTELWCQSGALFLPSMNQLLKVLLIRENKWKKTTTTTP